MADMIGHNWRDATITVEVRLFNSVSRYGDGPCGDGPCRPRTVTLPAGATIGELIGKLGIPVEALFLVMVNGRDVTSGLVGAAINGNREIGDGDVVALSGPVPYSYGYGAPVV